MIPQLERRHASRAPTSGIRGDEASDPLVLARGPARTSRPACSSEVVPGSPAGAGRPPGATTAATPRGGDVITSVAGEPVRSMDDVDDVLDRRRRRATSVARRAAARRHRADRQVTAGRAPRRPPPTARRPTMRGDADQVLRHHPPRGRRAAVELGAWALGMILWPGSRALPTRPSRPASPRAAPARRAASACSSTRPSTRSPRGRRDRPHARPAARRRGPGVLRRGGRRTGCR